jgi:hypothetical protein
MKTMKKILTLVCVGLISMSSFAQKKSADTVRIDLAKSSKVVFTMKDRTDLPLLKQYDYQALFNDIITKLEKSDSTTSQDSTQTAPVVQNNVVVTWDDDDDDQEYESKYHYHRTTHSFNFDFGTNNYLEDGSFPDGSGAQYTVRPWGSWYVGLNSTLRTRVSKNFFVEWGAGISWYNFKFQDDATLITVDDNDIPGVYFSEDTRDVSYSKSKLTASYINASLVPMFDAGGRGRKTRLWDAHNSNFRIGAGPYAGYRIESHSKLVYKEDGDKEKDKDKSNFYLNNFRYGIRMQVGIRSADFFFNYDLNELFIEGRGPKLNAFSFGVIF